MKTPDHSEPMPQAYFEEMYASSDDPWNFETSWYEARKYQLTVAALPQKRFRCGLEPGCANGVLTELLASRCDRLYAFDFIDSSVTRAQERLQHHRRVEVSKAHFPRWWPEGRGDLVVWSEIAYYLDSEQREVAAGALSEWLEPGGTLVAVHYTGATNYPMDGVEVARWIDSFEYLQRTLSVVDADFELVVWKRTRRFVD